MQIQKIQTSTTFTSLKNPIKTEKFLYKNELVTMREALPSDLLDVARDMKKWMSQSYKYEYCMGKEPKHQKAREIFQAIDKNQWLQEIKQHLVDMLKKPEASLLVARNQKNKLIGYATMENMNGAQVPTGIIENIHLELPYRDGELGKHLLDKITQTAQNTFDEVVVGSYSLGDRSIYRNAGYKFIDSEQYRKLLNARYDGVNVNDFWLKKDINH